VIGLHALRNALIPVGVIGLQVRPLGRSHPDRDHLLLAGIGSWLIESINRRDYPVLQGGVLLVASLVMAVNLASIFSTACSTPDPALMAGVPLEAAPIRAVIGEPRVRSRSCWLSFIENKGRSRRTGGHRLPGLIAIFADVISPLSRSSSSATRAWRTLLAARRGWRSARTDDIGGHVLRLDHGASCRVIDLIRGDDLAVTGTVLA